ncbi:MAG: hypothetical protein K940chlam3_00047 [Chlamydiae bacterium]|nr:hypothetical protein [Chlamydiota bacterium]
MKNIPAHNPQFVGIENLKKQHFQQLQQFENWAQNHDWNAFLLHHYDWWMFPIARTSAGQGAKYTIYQQEILDLKSDAEFMKNFRRGVELLVLSWGWDIENRSPISNPDHNQTWNHYEVRLGKMVDSLKLLGEQDYFNSIKEFFHSLPLDEQPKERWVRNLLEI